MIRIAITAGGTSEPIDGIRRLTNVSTGALGWHCLEAIFTYFEAKETTDFHIHYIHTENALLNAIETADKNHVSFIPVTDAASVFTAVDQLTKEFRIDYFIHSMAISDFTFAYAANVYDLSREISGFSTHEGSDEIKVMELLRNPASKYGVDEKISSDRDIVIGLKRTKKVIPLIKQNNENTILIGFKLLKGVSEKELIEVAAQLAEKNRCDLVLANEVSAIGDANHVGLLVKGIEIIARATGKKAIAKTIVERMFDLTMKGD